MTQHNKNVTSTIKLLCCHLLFDGITFEEFAQYGKLKQRMRKYLFLTFMYRLIFCINCKDSNKILKDCQSDINNSDIIDTSYEKFFIHCLTMTDNTQLIHKNAKNILVAALYLACRIIIHNFRTRFDQVNEVSWLLTEIKKRYQNCLSFIVKSNMSKYDDNFNTVTHWLAKYSNIFEYNREFKRLRQGIWHKLHSQSSEYNVDGWLPIHVACKNNSTMFVENYVATASKRVLAPITVGDGRMQTPLMIAIENYSFGTIEILCDKSTTQEVRDIGFYYYNELEYASYYFIRSHDDGNTNYDKSFDAFKLLWKTLFKQNEVTNSRQLVKYANDSNNKENNILSMVKSC